MPALLDILPQSGRVAGHAPWPRHAIDAETWQILAGQLADGRWTLVSLWAEPAMVHLALLDEKGATGAVVTLDCPNGHFPSIGALHAPAIRLERAICDLFGHAADGARDTRPWLDHGRWDVSQPLARVPSQPTPAPYSFLTATGESLHQIPVGPVHAGIIEPGHFRFTANGEVVVRLEERLGYTHKGVDALMIGTNLDRAAKIAGRISGDSTVAYAFAFARAVEAALGIEAPPRAQHLRGLMAELERIANHFGDIGAICNDATFTLLHAHCGILRERVLRASGECFGHRLMRDTIIPGGTHIDLAPQHIVTLRELAADLRRQFTPLIGVYDNTASLLDRTVTTGIAKPALVRQFGAGGYVGRASGRNFDARRAFRYPPYDALNFEVPTRQEGDVNARVWIRIEEALQSLLLIEQILERMPEGPVRIDIKPAGVAHEGLGIVEGFRGDIFAWVRLSESAAVERCHLRDPSWFQWPLLEAAVDGNIVADFPLCNKSFNCSYSGHDL